MPNIDYARNFLNCFRHNQHFRYHVDGDDDGLDFIYHVEVTIQNLKLTADFKTIGSRPSLPQCADFESWPPLEWTVSAPDMYDQTRTTILEHIC